MSSSNGSILSNNEVDRRGVTIFQLNQDHEPVMKWKLEKAWPVKLDSLTLGSIANDIAIESLELTHEGITIKTP
jgi:phage tail-like protein